MENSRDTICALASGALPAAIAIVRLSGPQTETILKELLGEIPAPRRASLRTLRDEQRAIIDHGLVVWMPGPDSYTGEDSAEFHLHGGVAVVEHVLKTLTAAKGVRLAEPGEFSRRAFEAGRMDLTQAEAVADLIDAESEAQKASALRQLAGERSRIYADWRTRLLRAAALVEAMIDFPDEDDAPDDVELDIRSVLSGVLEDIDAALDDEGLGERLRDGFRIALVGPPNAGKSTLMNALSRRDVSIVTDRPGTTRDLLESRIRIAGAVAWLVDTAGIRETSDEIEAEGVARATRAAEAADLRVFLVDASQPEDQGLIAAFQKPGDIVVLNKIDLAQPEGFDECLSISAEHGLGVSDLEAKIAEIVSVRAGKAQHALVTRARHRQRLEDGRNAIANAMELIDADAGMEIVGEELRRAIAALASVIGVIGVEDVLGEVFDQFCIGK